MKQTIEFFSKQYNWGWSVWLKLNGRKILLASKLKSQKEVKEFIQSISNTPIQYVKREKRKEEGITTA